MKKLFLTPLALAAYAFSASITLNPNVSHQQIIGFGGGAAYYQNWITALGDDTKKDFYDTAFTGLNISILRLGNWLQEVDSLDKIQPDVEIVKAGKDRLGNHLKILMSSWSAPGNLKQSGSVNGNAGQTKSDNTLKTSTTDKYGSYVYGDFASWWKKSYLAYRNAGISVDYVSLQNEPDMNATYEETLFNPTETSEVAGYDKALQAVYDSLNSISNPPKLYGPEVLGIGYNNFQNYAKALNKNYLAGYNYHLYHAGSGNDSSALNYDKPDNFRTAMKSIASDYTDKPLLMTEFCNMLGYERETDMIGLARIMQIGFTDGNLAGYIAWELFWGEGKGQLLGVCTKYWGKCTEDKIIVAPEYHAMRHFSKYVNPGWSRIDMTTSETSLDVVAFKNPTGDSITAIIINKSAESIQLNDYALENYSVVKAFQSKENGKKSKDLTLATCFILPARSITTLVYTKGIQDIPQNVCQDETTDSTVATEEIAESIVIADFSLGLGSWDTELDAPTLMNSPLDGVNTYVKVPFANDDQDSVGYKNVSYTIENGNEKYLSKCDSLAFVVHALSDDYSNFNVGAIGSEWINYQYGVKLPTTWDTVKVSLEKEADNGSTKLKFNSNYEGMYISKILATACKDPTAIPFVTKPQIQNNQKANLFDLNGKLIWNGLWNASMLEKNEIRLDVKQGVYLLQIGNNTKTVIKK